MPKSTRNTGTPWTAADVKELITSTRRRLPVLALGLLLAGCGLLPAATASDAGGTATPGATSSAATTAEATATASTKVPFPSGPPPQACVRPPPDLASMVGQARDPLSCYGGAVLTVDAIVASPGQFDCPGELQPSWFDCFHLVALNPLPGSAARPEFTLVFLSPDESLYAVIHPAIQGFRKPAMGRAMRVTGHYDDPAAQGCHYTSWADANPPSAAEVVHQCQSTFVITAMEPLGVS